MNCRIERFKPPLVGMIAVLFVAIAACSGGGQGPTDPNPDAGSDGGMGVECETGETSNGLCNRGSTCTDSSQCATGLCSRLGLCVSPQCDNNVQDEGEEGTDCGGPCPACTGTSCQTGNDCRSKVCEGGDCARPSCDDGVQNGTETGVDCGGDSCRGCDVGGPCGRDLDCRTRRCENRTCQSIPNSCTDGSRNGSETDVDCGGPKCGACSVQSNCGVNGDCLTGFCDFGRCRRPTCSDDTVNGTETDVDCGGRTCEQCEEGDSCETDADCETYRCEAGECVSCEDTSGGCAVCNDGQQNAGESDVDCGGPLCGSCTGEQSCETDDDCGENGICTEDSTCATCSDGVQNGGEVRIDCGGPRCAKCLSRACSSDDECKSNRCAETADFCNDRCCASENMCVYFTNTTGSSKSRLLVLFAAEVEIVDSGPFTDVSIRTNSAGDTIHDFTGATVQDEEQIKIRVRETDPSYLSYSIVQNTGWAEGEQLYDGRNNISVFPTHCE